MFDCSLPLDKVESENKLLYWFHFIQSQIGTNTPVILIATKIDLLCEKIFENMTSEIKNVDIFKDVYQENFSNVSGDFGLDYNNSFDHYYLNLIIGNYFSKILFLSIGQKIKIQQKRK